MTIFFSGEGGGKSPSSKHWRVRLWTGRVLGLGVKGWPQIRDTHYERPAKVSFCPPVWSQVDPDLSNSTYWASTGSTPIYAGFELFPKPFKITAPPKHFVKSFPLESTRYSPNNIHDGNVSNVATGAMRQTKSSTVLTTSCPRRSAQRSTKIH